MKTVFIDRDGTIIAESPDEKIDSFEKLELIPGAIRGMRMLVDMGYTLVMVTNQDGLGTPVFPMDTFAHVHEKLLRILEGEGIRFQSIFICPHLPEDNCSCRKPKAGLLEEFLKDNEIDLDKSYVLGDRITDVQLAQNMGCRSILLKTNDIDSQIDGSVRPDYVTRSFFDACEYIIRRERHSAVRRHTNETDISVEVFLDGSGDHTIDTGIGFFDHMLAQLSRHSHIDLTLKVEGDLRVDEHHTVEDAGLALGEAVRAALGDKRGIGRYGFVVPMDEALVQVAVDLSGRPYFSFSGEFERERVGEFPTELVEDFFRAFSDGLRANLHISVRGRNDHHKIEAIFKGVARSLRQAVARDIGRPSEIPSTKGVL